MEGEEDIDEIEEGSEGICFFWKVFCCGMFNDIYRIGYGFDGGFFFFGS